MINEKRLFTVPETREYLSIGHTTLYKLVKNGVITPIKIGKATRFDRQTLDDFISNKLLEV